MAPSQLKLTAFFKPLYTTVALSARKTEYDDSGTVLPLVQTTSHNANADATVVISDDKNDDDRDWADDDDDGDDDAALLRESDIEVIQGQVLQDNIQGWLEDLQAQGQVTDRGDSSLKTRFIQSLSEQQFRMLPQRLREDSHELRSRVAYLVDDMLRTDSQIDEPAPDSDIPQHKLLWNTMAAKAKVWKSKRDNYRYRSILTRYTSDELFAELERCSDDSIWKECVVGGRVDPVFIHTIQEDWRYDGPGWYYAHMWNTKKQVWKWSRRYVGQSGGGGGGKGGKKGDIGKKGKRRGIRSRTGNHVTNSKNLRTKELFYRAWRNFESHTNNMNEVKFFKLGLANESFFDVEKDFDQFLSLGEMFFALVFRTIQRWDIERWLPKSLIRNTDLTDPLGLNAALPLAQGVREDAMAGTAKLIHSADLKVAAFWRSICSQNIQKVYDDNFKHNTTALRRRGTWEIDGLAHDGAPGQTVQVKCAACGWRKDDDKPRYVTRTGEYINRLSPCESYQPSAADLAKGNKNAIKRFKSIDPNVRAINRNTISRRLNNNHNKVWWREYYVGVRFAHPPVGPTREID